jgi:hypothetical protein
VTEIDEHGTKRPRWLRRTLLIVGAVVLALVILAGGTILVLRARDSTTDVSLDDAVGSFRESEAVASPESRIPLPGVYVYETVGDERIDALGGATHTYPAETTMSYTLTECGYRVRWDVFEERFDELDLCITEEGETVDTTRQYREFFGIGNDLTYRCDAAAIVRAEPTELDVTRSTPCTAEGTDAEIRVTVVGVEPIDVGGVPIDSVHILLETTLTGNVRGGSRVNYWADPVTGLIFRRETKVTSNADSPLGVTTYEEDYTVQLVSLEPRR